MDEGMSAESPRPVMFRLLGGLAIVVVVLVAAHLYWGPASEKNPLKNYADVLYLVPNSDGTVGWYDYENGALVQHPPFAPGTVTGVARAGSVDYFSIVPVSPHASSTVYRYQNGSYTKIFESARMIQGLSVSRDGASIGIDGVGPDGKNAAVVDTAAGSVFLLGDSMLPPEFLSENGNRAVIYAAGTSIFARIFANGQWQSPLTVFTSTGATVTAFATDGGKSFAFVEPDRHGIQEWQVSSFGPFAAALQKSLPPMLGSSLAYGGGALFAYHFSPAPIQSRFHSLLITNIATGDNYSFVPPQNLGPAASVILLPISAP